MEEPHATSNIMNMDVDLYPSVISIVKSFSVEKRDKQLKITKDNEKIIYFVDQHDFNHMLTKYFCFQEIPDNNLQYLNIQYRYKDNMNFVCTLIKPNLSIEHKLYLTEVDDIPYITEDNELIIDCGQYNTVRNIEEILRFVVALRYKKGKNQTTFLKTTILGSNYNVCIQALASIREFYTKPHLYDFNWSRYTMMVNNVKHINKILRVKFGSWSLSKILQKHHDVNYVQDFEYVTAHLNTYKKLGQKDDVLNIVDNMISILQSQNNLRPLHLQNRTEYELEWHYDQGVGHLSINNVSQATTTIIGDIEERQEWKITMILNSGSPAMKMNEANQHFITALLNDYMKYPRKCIDITLRGTCPMFLIKYFNRRAISSSSSFTGIVDENTDQDESSVVNFKYTITSNHKRKIVN